jgi:hypothetical protein
MAWHSWILSVDPLESGSDPDPQPCLSLNYVYCFSIPRFCYLVDSHCSLLEVFKNRYYVLQILPFKNVPWSVSLSPKEKAENCTIGQHLRHTKYSFSFLCHCLQLL